MNLSHSEVEFLIERLNNGDPIPEDYKHKLFPIKQVEYELAYAGKMRKEDVFANEDGVFPVPLQVEKKYYNNYVDNEWANMIVFGDNLQFLKTVYENKDPIIKDIVKGKVKLIYIDPPYATESDFKTVKGQNAYSDKKRGADFIEFLRRRLILAKSILAQDGTIYVHTDSRKGHYIKVIMDEIFSDFDFGEIIWVCGLMGSGSFYPKAHETIYCYKRKGKNFEPPKRLGLSKRITKALQKDDEGWFYTRGRESSGGSNYLKSYIWDDPNIAKEEAIVKANQSRLQPVWSVWIGKEEIALAYNDHPVGTYAYTPIDSWNYPTQKPERLIKRIIEASSEKGDLVMDFFAGSGTTIAVAEKLNRKWIACDVGKLAFYTMQKRILNIEHSRNLEEHEKRYGINHRSFITVNTGIYDLNKLFRLNKDHYTEFVMNLFQVEKINKKIGGIRIDGERKDGYYCIIYPYWDFKNAEVNQEYLEDLHLYLGNKINERIYIIAPANYVNFITDYQEIGSIKYYFLKVPYQVIKELHKVHFKKIRQPQSKNKVNDLEDVIGFHFIRQPYVKSEVILNDNKIQILIKDFLSDYAEEETNKDMGNFESLAMVLIDNNYNDEIFIMDNYYFANDLLPKAKKDEDEETIKQELKQQKEIMIELDRDKCGRKVMVIYIDIYGNEFKEALLVGE
jgi:adenine-specific DNA-methyltransferase